MKTDKPLIFSKLRVLAISSMIALAVEIDVAAQSITFDELPAQQIDDLSFNGVTFDFKVAGADSADATFNAPGLVGQNFTDLQVLEGDANGILTFDFDKRVSTFSFGATLNSPAIAATPGLTVDLFGANLVPLGTIPLALNSVGAAFLEGQFIYPGGPPVLRATIDFLEGSAGLPPRFQIDNLTYVLFVPPVIAPPPPPPLTPANPIPPPPAEPQPFLLVDFEAINAANTSGLAVPSALQGILKSVNQPALRDINGRLFRARSRGATRRVDTTRDRSLTRVVNFADEQNIDYRVALGLREPQSESVDSHDTLLQGSYPFGLMGISVPFSNSQSSGYTSAAPVGGGEKNPVLSLHDEFTTDPQPGRWEVFTSVDFGNDDLDDLTRTFVSYQTEIYAGTLGVEYQVNHWLTTGFAFSHLESQSELSSNLGSIDIDGRLYTAYLTAFHRGFYADLLYSHGRYDNHLVRNPLFGSHTFADPGSTGNAVAFNLGKVFAVGDQVTTGPILAAEYNGGRIDAYRERGNQRANLSYSGADFDSLITRLGWQFSHQATAGNTNIQSQLRLAWERENLAERDRISATLQQSPFLLVTPGVGSERIGGFGASGNQAAPGTDWLAFGAGVRFAFGNDLNLLLDYEGRYFRNNRSSHLASIKLGYTF